VDLPEPVLTARGLSQAFGRRVLFRDLELDVGAGDVLAVTGPNGSGKSTLLQILAGLREATAGTVTLHHGEHAIAPQERPLQVGFVAPYLNVYDEFTARENLDFLARVRRMRLPEGHIDELLDHLGLEGRADDLVRTFSSGMKQRVRFASALLPSPSVLFLDEPGSNLDVAGRTLVEELVSRQLSRGGAVVLATNNDEEAALCDRVLLLGDGDARVA